jgi:Skp family chaperone for outer membrane proteins
MVCFAITTFHSLRFVKSAAALSPVRVGVINVQQVILSTLEGKQALVELQDKFAQLQRDLAILGEQINSVRQRLEAGQTLGQAEETYRLRSDGERFKILFERKTKEFNEDLQLERSKIVDDIRRKVINLLVRYSRENGYAIIFDSSVQDSLIVYKSTDLDVTPEIIRLYDNSGKIH